MMKQTMVVGGVALAALLCGCAGPKAREVQLDQRAMSAAIASIVPSGISSSLTSSRCSRRPESSSASA